MRLGGRTKLGFYPLPAAEAERLRKHVCFASEFAAIDPCVGDGVAFSELLKGANAYRYGIELDANRAEQARQLGVETLQASAMDVRCPAESISLLYLNPPYDFEAGQTNNQRLELIFLEHTYRWLKPGGVLLFAIPQPQLQPCARLLSEHFANLAVYKLTEPASVQYKQVAVLGVRRKRHRHLRDAALLDSVGWLERLATNPDVEALGEAPRVRYEVPQSGPVTLTHAGIPLDEVEDLLFDSAAYRHASSSLEELMRALIEAMVDAHSADPELYELLATEVPHRADGTRDFAVRLHGVFRLAIASRAHQLKKGRDLESLVFVVTNMVESLSHAAMFRRPPRLSLAAAKAEVVRAVLAYLHS